MRLFLRAFVAALLSAAAIAGTARAAGDVLVLNSGDATLSIVDISQLREVARIPVLREPHHWALAPDGRTLLVGDTGGNALFVLNPDSFAVLRRVPCADPYQLGFSPDGKFLVVNGLARNQVDVYDAATLRLVHRFPLASMPSHLAFSPDGGRVFVSLQGARRLAAIDLGRMQVLWQAEVGRAPAGVLWLGGRVLVALMGEDDFAVLDPADGRIERRVVTGKGTHQLYLSPDQRTLWVNARLSNITVALDAGSFAVRRRYAVPGGPDDIAFAPDGRLWITERFARAVAVLDPASGAVQSVDVGRSPHGLFLNAHAVPASVARAD